VGWALLAALGWAGYVLLSRRVGARTSGVEGLSLSLAVAALLTLPLWLPRAAAGEVGAPELAIAASSAALGVALAFALELQALRVMTARVVSILFALEPAVALGVGVVLLGQRAGPADLGGVACVVAAGVGVSVTSSGR
jgi:inner membrane transporter RhtA